MGDGGIGASMYPFLRDEMDEESTARWLVRLKGENPDLEDLVALFTSPDFRVVRGGDDYFLVAASLEGFGTTVDVLEAARSLISLMNGVAKVSQPAFHEVQADGLVVEFTESGGKKYSLATGGSITPRGRREHQVISVPSIQIRPRVYAPSITVEGEATPQPQPGSLETDRWAEIAGRDPDVAEALEIFGSRSHNWINLYKVYEIVNRRAEIVGEGWVSARVMERFTRTANHPRAGGRDARHARSRVQPPPKPMSLEEGVALIRILTGWLKSLVSSGPNP